MTCGITGDMLPEGRCSPMRHLILHRPHRHARQTCLAAITFGAGLVAFLCSLTGAVPFAAVSIGIAAFFSGLYSQLISVTTNERWLNVLGIGLAFVAVGLGLRQGGFTI
jgi:hypothetical protein